MLELFFSYSHEDEALRDDLEVHLSMLKRQNVISTWHDRRIVAGEDFGSKIDDQLERADIVLLLGKRGQARLRAGMPNDGLEKGDNKGKD
jgi:hypothetical protein